MQAMDNRAQGAIGIVRFFGTLILGAPLTYFAWKITQPLLERSQENANAAGATKVADASGWLGSTVEYGVFIFLMVSFFGLVVYAVYQRRVVG